MDTLSKDCGQLRGINLCLSGEIAHWLEVSNDPETFLATRGSVQA